MKIQKGWWIRKRFIGLIPLIAIGWDIYCIRLYFEWLCFVSCIFFWNKNGERYRLEEDKQCTGQ